MRSKSFIGGLVLLFVPFAYVDWDLIAFESTSFLSLLWLKFEESIFGFSGSETQFFSFDWLSREDVYGAYFGDLWFVGVLILITAIVIVVYSVISEKNVGAILLIGASILLIVIRFIRLNELDLSYYQSQDTLLGTTSYLEIPLAGLIGLILGILDLRSSN